MSVIFHDVTDLEVFVVDILVVVCGWSSASFLFQRLVNFEYMISEHVLGLKKILVESGQLLNSDV